MTAIEFETGRAGFAVLPPLRALSDADEIHHRVANNLQLLSAMALFEAREIADPAALAALEMMRQRIVAIAGVHRALYQAPATSTVRLDAYLEDLARGL